MSIMAGNDLLYKRKILKQLYFKNSLSCADLSKQIKKSFPLTTRMVNELINEGFVIGKGFAPSSGGRRPLTYSLKPGILYVVAVAMDQFITRMVMIDLQSGYVSEIEKFELPLPRNPDALSRLVEKINLFIINSGVEKERIAGVGIGMPGFVDSKKGLNYSFLETDGKSITEYLAAILGLPVFIDNDSRLIALAELRFGKARKKKDAMIVNIGWGIGLGLVLNGELFKGHNGFAGEFSHIPLFSNNKLCSCGKSGCLETEASLLVVIEKAKSGLNQGEVSVLRELLDENIDKDAETIIRAAEKGDKFAVELLSEAGYSIGRGLAILIHLINPEIIILSGRGSLGGKLWLAPIQQALNEHCIPRLAVNTDVEISGLGHEAELIGAAALVMENFEHFEPDLHQIKRNELSI
jgi:predicted NBD/HSP70 family sugar kinase